MYQKIEAFFLKTEHLIGSVSNLYPMQILIFFSNIIFQDLKINLYRSYIYNIYIICVIFRWLRHERSRKCFLTHCRGPDEIRVLQGGAG